MVKINYMLAAWSGPRRCDNVMTRADRGLFLREHMKRLQQLKHTHIGQFTVAVPENPEEPKEFLDALIGMPASIGGAPVVPFRRRNVGMSYGSLNDAFAKDHGRFDYFIFMEDDYVFSMDHYDQALLDFMADPKVGYVAGLVRGGQLPKHAGNSNGLLRTSALMTLWNQFGYLPHAQNSVEYPHVEHQGQLGLSIALLNAGWEIVSVTSRYRSIFKFCQGYDPEEGSGQLLMEPIEGPTS